MKSMFVWPISRQHLSLGEPLPLLGDVEDHVGHKHRGIHAGGDAEPEGDGEALDLLGTQATTARWPQSSG